MTNLIKRGIIRKSESNWRNPIRFIKKPYGGLRLVVNMIALNDLVAKDPYKIRNMKEILHATHGSRFFMVIDLQQAFFSI